MSILKENNCTIDETLMGPDCDLIHCTVQSVRFDVIRTIDGNGSFIYCENSDGMRFIENMFERNKERFENEAGNNRSNSKIYRG